MGDNAMATRAKCSGRLLCATAMSRPILPELLILLSYHLIHNCYKYTAACPHCEVRRARKPELLTELPLRLTHRGTVLSSYSFSALGSAGGAELLGGTERIRRDLILIRDIRGMRSCC